MRRLQLVASEAVYDRAWGLAPQRETPMTPEEKENAVVDALVLVGDTPDNARRWLREVLTGPTPRRGTPAPHDHVPNARRAVSAPPAPKPKTRDDVWSAIQTAAFAERKPGQTNERAISDYLATDRGRQMYGEYVRAPAPPAQDSKPSGPATGSEALFERHRRLALAEHPDLSPERAVDRWYVGHPEAYQAYQDARRSELRRG